MNSTVQAERLAKAIQAIQAEAERLGGRLKMPSVRAPDPAAKYTLILEAVAASLAGIGAPGGNVETEPVEAVIAVVKEPAKAAPKSGKGKV